MSKRGPYRKGEAKRAEILTVALEIFAAEGYRGTSLRKVAERCGLSLPGVMHYFESKEDLLVQVLRMRDETANQRHPELHGIGDFTDIVHENMNTPGLVELFVSMAASAKDPSHPAHEFFAHRYETLRPALASWLDSRAEAGELRTDLPTERLATLVLAAIDGIQLQWLADPSLDMRQPVTDLLTQLGLPNSG
ncbi:TetR/AcrR family transcriptional regulator [Streptacidiphilus fuscans]|uniref:TetR/AcrR family transcriptional regulator n=1 Tax=Streptacidiphilus fuscans TaxID=2789292 RepID=A0A931AVZ2_9ACTN|nr:TetR/AcrR family transcriptional regulator [Streptacidiphilus fuscans]MBF9066479.1 TetR/AcrR family transcriptional regulator [Streptacidiphilus fuscans]